MKIKETNLVFKLLKKREKSYTKNCNTRKAKCKKKKIYLKFKRKEIQWNILLIKMVFKCQVQLLQPLSSLIASSVSVQPSNSPIVIKFSYCNDQNQLLQQSRSVQPSSSATIMIKFSDCNNQFQLLLSSAA